MLVGLLARMKFSLTRMLVEMGQASRGTTGEPCVEGMDLGVERGEQEERGTVMLRGLVSLRGDGLEVTASCVSLCFLPNLRGDGLTRIVSCVSVLQLLSGPCAFSLNINDYSNIPGANLRVAYT